MNDNINTELSGDNAMDFTHAQHSTTFDTKIDEIILRISQNDTEQERELRQNSNCVLNMQQQYKVAQDKIHKFGADILRTVVTEYLLKHDLALANTLKCSAPPDSSDDTMPELSSGEWRFVDDIIVAYQPEFSPDLPPVKQATVYFKIPENFFPDITGSASNIQWLSTREQNHEHPWDASPVIDIGTCKLDVPTFFSNYYLAITAGLCIFRIPYIVDRLDGQELSFNVKIAFNETHENLVALDAYTDFALDNLISKAKIVALDTVMAVSAVVEKMQKLRIAGNKLQEEMKTL